MLFHILKKWPVRKKKKMEVRKNVGFELLLDALKTIL